MNIQILAPNPMINQSWYECFREVLAGLHLGLGALGVETSEKYRIDDLESDIPTIVIGAHLLSPSELQCLPRDTIIYNFEPMGDNSARVWGGYHKKMLVLKRFIIWDYSLKNIAFWHQLGVCRVIYMPLAYHKKLESSFISDELNKINDSDKDIDVLFYGRINPHRAKILHDLQCKGVRVKQVNAFGVERDRYLMRSRLVLNLHFYECNILEVVRVSYLWANKVPVLCEVNSNTEIPYSDTSWILQAPYGEVVEQVMKLLKEPERLHIAAERAYEGFVRETSSTEMLLNALEKSGELSSGHIPKNLFVGNFNDAPSNMLNAGIPDKTDVPLDLSVPFKQWDQIFPSEKFGEVFFFPNMFSKIVVQDLSDFSESTMDFLSNCMQLLELEGELQFSISYGIFRSMLQQNGRSSPDDFLKYGENWWYTWTADLVWDNVYFDFKCHLYDLTSEGMLAYKNGMLEDDLKKAPDCIDRITMCFKKKMLKLEEPRCYFIGQV